VDYLSLSIVSAALIRRLQSREPRVMVVVAVVVRNQLYYFRTRAVLGCTFRAKLRMMLAQVEGVAPAHTPHILSP
jgi:hypothetical protein